MSNFFDKVLDGIDNGISYVGENSKTVIGKTRIQKNIVETETEKRKLTMSMGNLVYNLQEKGEIDIEQCRDICKEISALNIKIEKLKEEMRVADAQSIQHAKQQSQQPDTGVPTNMGVKCICGHMNKSGAKFCSGCGKHLTTN